MINHYYTVINKKTYCIVIDDHARITKLYEKINLTLELILTLKYAIEIKPELGVQYWTNRLLNLKAFS